MQALRRRYDMKGVGRYWVFLELCAEKMEKRRGEEFVEKHCRFDFEKHYLMRSLDYANVMQVSRYLHALAELGLCSVVETDEVFECFVPKLLECIDRDSKRARPKRDQDAPKMKKEDKDKEEEEEGKAPQPPPPPVQIPKNYSTFADQFDPEKRELVERGMLVVQEVLGGPLSPDWKNIVPALLRAVDWDSTQFTEILAGLKTDFDEKSSERNYREVTIKRRFGLIGGRA